MLTPLQPSRWTPRWSNMPVKPPKSYGIYPRTITSDPLELGRHVCEETSVLPLDRTNCILNIRICRRISKRYRIYCIQYRRGSLNRTSGRLLHLDHTTM